MSIPATESVSQLRLGNRAVSEAGCREVETAGRAVGGVRAGLAVVALSIPMDLCTGSGFTRVLSAEKCGSQRSLRIPISGPCFSALRNLYSCSNQLPEV